MLASKVETPYTVMRIENCPSDRSSDSRNIIMEFIPNSLVGQVNLSSPAEVNFQSSSCTHVIAERQQYKKSVLSCSCHPGTVLSMSPCVFSSLLITSPQSTDYARGHIKPSSYPSKPFTISYRLRNPDNIRGSKYRLATPPTTST